MDERRRQYVEDAALIFERTMGMPRMTGRICALLMIADPPEMTMPDITDALQTSKSSVSTALQMLTSLGLTERLSLPGERRDYFRLSGKLWYGDLRAAVDKFVGMRTIAERGMALMKSAESENYHKLQAMYDLQNFLAREFPALLERWEAEHEGTPLRRSGE